MKLSIIIPAGRPESAGRTIHSVLRQGQWPGDMQLIVVGADLDPLRREFAGAQIEYVPLIKRCNPSQTRIAGIEKAAGDWYLFVDDDIELDAFFLERLAPLIAGEKNLGAIGARLPGSEMTYFSRVTDLTNFWSQQSADPGARDWLYSAVLAVPADAYREAGGFNPDLAIGEDVDLTERIQYAGYKVVYHPELVGYHNHRRSTFGRALSYFWANGDLARHRFETNGELRVWSAKHIVHTFVVSLRNTWQRNGQPFWPFLYYLPGIVFMYGAYAWSLELHYQKYVFACIDKNKRAALLEKYTVRNGFFRRYIGRKADGKTFAPVLHLMMAFISDNLMAIVLLGILVIIGTAGLCE